MEALDLHFEDIKKGDTASFSHTWTEGDQESFARLSGNMNPLHTDEVYARTTKFKKRLVYGMHVAILCSTFVGMYLPGKRCLCLQQSLSFKKPIFIDDTVTLKGIVMSKSLTTGILDIAISVFRDSDIVVEGVMVVQVLP